MRLGMSASNLTIDSVVEAWKIQISAPGVHPGQGGDNETAISLNVAKDIIVQWLQEKPRIS